MYIHYLVKETALHVWWRREGEGKNNKNVNKLQNKGIITIYYDLLSSYVILLIITS